MTAPVVPSLASVNLNLLVALDALLNEAHVGRAAQRLGVTQSAMSQSLKQLRDLYEDPLLTRGQFGLVLTPRAQEIVRGLKRGLAELHLTFAPLAFDPRTAVRSFTLGLSDWMAAAIVPALVQLCTAEAPGVSLRIAAFEIDAHRRAALLETGDTAVFIGAHLDPYPQIQHHALFDSGMVGFARLGHPVVHDQLTLEEYAALTHVVYSSGSPDALSWIDVALEAAGLTRRVVLRTAYLTVAALAIAESDHVLVARRHVAAGFTRRFRLQTFELPVPSRGNHSMDLVWHDRFTGDPAHRWLRDCVIRAWQASEL